MEIQPLDYLPARYPPSKFCKIKTILRNFLEDVQTESQNTKISIKNFFSG